jgi:hypothetical protein
VQIGVADAASRYPDECLTRSGIRNDHGLGAYRFTLSGADHAQHLLAHGFDHADRPGAPQCDVGQLPRGC